MYFSNLPKTKYQFGTNSESNVHKVADIFNRKIVNEPIANYTFMDIYETPLEEPDQQLGRGDIIVLKSDLDAGSCTDPNNLDCHISYAVIENWDPILKQIWCKVYRIGSSGASTESKLFANQNKFRIFKRDWRNGSI